MKKFLSFMLVLAMIASMMCINVAAAPEHLVGSYKGPDNGTIDDGVEVPFTSNHGGSEIVATVALTVSTRYAVDLEYTEKSITLKNDTEWDVNNLKYVGTVSYSIGNVTEDFPTSGEVGVSIGDFTITNYSNAAVYVTANAAVGSDDSITAAVKEVAVNGSDTAEAKVISNNENYSEVPAVETDRVANGVGTAQKCSYSAYMTSEDWLGTLWSYDDGEEITIARITFTVTSSAPAVQQSSQGE